MRNDETSEVLNVNLPPKDVFNQLIEYFGDKFIKQKVPSSHINGRWAGGSFKIDINPSNGKSQVKVNFSCLYMYLLVLFLIIVFFIRLLINPTSYPYFLSSAIMMLFLSQWMKRNVMKRLKEFFKT